MSQHIKVGIIGEYDANRRYHIETNDALNHAAAALSITLESSWISPQPLSIGSVETTKGICETALTTSRSGSIARAFDNTGDANSM